MQEKAATEAEERFSQRDPLDKEFADLSKSWWWRCLKGFYLPFISSKTSCSWTWCSKYFNHPEGGDNEYGWQFWDELYFRYFNSIINYYNFKLTFDLRMSQFCMQVHEFFLQQNIALQIHTPWFQGNVKNIHIFK